MLSRTGPAASMLLLSLAGLLVGLAQADILYTFPKDTTCGVTFHDIIGTVYWPGPYYSSYYAALCGTPNAVVTLYANMDYYCQGTDIEGAIKYLSAECEEDAFMELLPREDFAANLTKEAIAALPVVTYADALLMVNATAPFLVDRTWFEAQYKTDDQWESTMRSHGWYTVALYCFWCIILGIGMIQNALRIIAETRRGYVLVDAEGQGRKAAPAGLGLVSRADALLRKYFTTPSALPPYHSRRFFGCTIPTRAESFVVLSYWIINIVLSCVSYTAFRGNLYYNSPSTQLWRYVADRTGIMSYGNIPLMYMFSGRNNIFLLLTGWSFGTFNIFHRHIARISTLQAIVHSIAYTGFYFDYGHGASYYYSEYADLWFQLGVAATVVMSFIIFFSFSIFRNKLYDTFLITHIVLAAVLIAFLWYHTSIFALKKFNNPFLISSAVIWGFDRFLRLVRQAYIQLHVSRNRRSMLFTDTTVTYHADADMLLIDTVPANTHLFPSPGQHYYLYQPLRFLGWENHPFTLANWHTDADSGDLHLQFWVRPVSGWTRKLRNECQRKGKASGGASAAMASFSTKMLLEGPYGKREPVHCFEEVLLVAGGSGIAGVLPYLRDFVRRADSAAKTAAGGVVPTRTRHVTLVWADRREAFLRYIADEALGDLMHHPSLTIHLHQTSSSVAPAAGSSTASSSTEAVQAAGVVVSSSSGDGKGSGSGSDARDEEKSALAAGAKATPYRIHSGRPDVLASLETIAQAVRGTQDRLAVVMCGPNQLADAVRAAVVRNMETSRDAIEYFEETFGW